jgi:hypothetical protein
MSGEVVVIESSNPTIKVSTPGNLVQIEPYTLQYPGLLEHYIGVNPLPLDGPYALASVRFYLGTESQVGDVQLDLKCNDVSIFGSPVVIRAGEKTILATSLATTTLFSPGDLLTVDIVNPGLSLTASDLTVTLRLKRLF